MNTMHGDLVDLPLFQSYPHRHPSQSIAVSSIFQTALYSYFIFYLFLFFKYTNLKEYGEIFHYYFINFMSSYFTSFSMNVTIVDFYV